jgi:hypothetical protein
MFSRLTTPRLSSVVASLAMALLGSTLEAHAAQLDVTLLHGGCEARVGAGERSITRHGRRWLARDRA